MLPFKDDNPTETFPYLTVAFIVLNVAAFVYEVVVGVDYAAFSYGALPAALMGRPAEPQPVHPAVTVLTSMFLHGGVVHLLGNMLYLWIFGNNIEDRLGPVRFVLFYLLGGLVAVYAHALTSPGSSVPMVGASGAIAAVLGAYLVLYPHAKVHTLVFLGFYVEVVRLPALIVIGFWAIIQFISGLTVATQAAGGGTAWFAHIGGFVFGVAAIRLFVRNTRKYRRSETWS